MDQRLSGERGLKLKFDLEIASLEAKFTDFLFLEELDQFLERLDVFRVHAGLSFLAERATE